MSKWCYGYTEQLASLHEVKKRISRSSWSCIHWNQLSARRLSRERERERERERTRVKIAGKNFFELKLTSVNPCRVTLKMPPFCPFVSWSLFENCRAKFSTQCERIYDLTSSLFNF